MFPLPTAAWEGGRQQLEFTMAEETAAKLIRASAN
jgi:hypothetical protein